MSSSKPSTPWREKYAEENKGLGHIDLWLAGTAFVLLLVGLVMVYSASTPIALKKYDDSTHYALRNAVFALAGLAAMAWLSRLPIATIRALSRTAFWVLIFLLVLVFVPGIGMEGGGARRWINLRLFTLQPSEPFKVTLILYVAHLLALEPQRVRYFKEGLLPLLGLFGLGAVLLMAEPDFGATLICGMVVVTVIFIAGMPLSWITAVAGAAIPLAAAGVIMAPYRFRRVTSFLDPWDDPLNSDFQLAQSLISFGSGGVMGAGLGEGQQKQFYLPEAHTDFIFAVIGEELGLIWILVIIALFALLVWRAMLIARMSDDLFVRLSSAGLTTLIASQAIANMAVVMGLLPPKGLTLPLVSYGGSSMVITLSSIGLLLAFSRTLPAQNRGGATSRDGPSG
ncbi:putative peptidoglycan glycosyltransferase FtsW [Candidatus Magnetaquicoccaceae bacterium FCR-1]|uniref:Probable peptidoglycan glycosyltransferase FtsW n=1 Tax=Candidatus Magnetaquiglobus chichijimensis TaxID=3141448 RepID=A0ABQ0CBM6_9PROT